ncbi:MAG TPA: hypothetical protein V6D29_05110 [Leptolyngbyaceae cyanobacterium]
MANLQEPQSTKLTPAERRVKKANDHLREEFGIKIRIDLAGHSLRIRKTLPPRPGSGKTKWHQQTLTLGLTADREGVNQAFQDVIHLNTLLSQRKFDWKTWDQHIRLPCKARVNQNELIGVQIEKFKKHFLALPKQKITREEAWRTSWSVYFNKLPSEQYLTDQVILDAIRQKTEEASAGREKFCIKLKAFIKFLDFETELDLGALGKGYDIPPVTEDELPTDEEILAALDLIDDPEWRTAYLLQAVFGLRNHEIFFLDRSKEESYYDITVLNVSKETKTGFHPVAALYPEWFNNPEWNLQTAKLPEVELDLEKTTLSKIGANVTDAFRKFGIPFIPYRLRHAWARRAMEFGFTDEAAAEFMGHGVEVHRKHYHRLIAKKHGLRLAQSFIGNPNRPKPPQK